MKKKFTFAVLAFVLFFSPSPLLYGQTSHNVKVKESLDLVEAEHKKETIPAVTPAQTLENNTPEEIPKETEATQAIGAAKKNIFSTAQLHGYYLNRNYFDKTKDSAAEDTYELRQRLRLELSQRLSDKLKYLVSLDNKYDFLHNSVNGFSADTKKTQLWECYADILNDNLTLRLGRQVIRWGKGDEVNPTDNFTPQDLTEFLNWDRADRKIPIWMAKADYSFGAYRLEGIWIPFFEPDLIAETGSEWEPYLLRQYHTSVIPINVEEPRRPAHNLRSQVAAVKITRATETYDLSLSYAYHYDQLPALYLLPSSNQNFVYDISQRYPRQHTIGSDFETLIGKVGVRGEFAYTFGDLFITNSIDYPSTIIRKNSFTGIIGGDYTFTNNAYLNIQYLAQYVPDNEENMTSHMYEDSIITKMSKKFFHDTLLFEFSSRLYLFNLDRFWRVKCEYDLTDSIKLTVGYDNYFGPSDGTFGQYNKNDQFFANMKYSF